MIQGQLGLVLTAGVDGVGTKTELAERTRFLQHTVNVQEQLRDHTGISKDVMAMCVDDLARDGIEPFGFYALYDTNSLKPEVAERVTDQLASGMVMGSLMAQVVFMGGESAELGDRVDGYGEFNYNLGGFAMGVGHQDRIITGEKVKPGDKIMALFGWEEKRGFRSNGMSLVRKVLAAEFGPEWYHAVDTQLMNDILTPSDIFTPTLVNMHGGYDIEREPKVADLHGIVHVTGGGIPGKLQRLLAVAGVGAVLDNPMAPIGAMRRLQEMSLRHNDLAAPDPDAYQSLNMGVEMMVVVPESEVGSVEKAAYVTQKRTKVMGEVVEKPGIEIKSKGVTHEGEWIRFVPKTA
jgi:phosphoribosylformylglycinamidine cyclo-ligase